MGGFTVTELMIVVAIMALLAAIAAPSMGTMIKRQRIKTAAFDVFSSMAFSRSEAVKRNTSVTLTPTGGDWAKGWSIADSNGNVLRNRAAGTTSPSADRTRLLSCRRAAYPRPARRSSSPPPAWTRRRSAASPST
jgi:prepilin-type N-terminal cleavage/methylation domain-containing protein